MLPIHKKVNNLKQTKTRIWPWIWSCGLPGGSTAARVSSDKRRRRLRRYPFREMDWNNGINEKNM